MRDKHEPKIEVDGRQARQRQVDRETKDKRLPADVDERQERQTDRQKRRGTYGDYTTQDIRQRRTDGQTDEETDRQMYERMDTQAFTSDCRRPAGPLTAALDGERRKDA